MAVSWNISSSLMAIFGRPHLGGLISIVADTIVELNMIRYPTHICAKSIQITCYLVQCVIVWLIRLTQSLFCRLICFPQIYSIIGGLYPTDDQSAPAMALFKFFQVGAFEVWSLLSERTCNSISFDIWSEEGYRSTLWSQLIYQNLANWKKKIAKVWICKQAVSMWWLGGL